MNTSDATFYDGTCTCRFVRYRMTTKPLFVHCCHCRWCQRETGSSFALNAMIEADRVPPDIPAVAEYYKASQRWPLESLARRAQIPI